MTTAKSLHADYLAAGGKKAFTSFPNKAAIAAALAALKPAPAPAPKAKKAARANGAADGVKLNRVQRARLRKYVAKHGLTHDRGDRWVLTDDLKAVLGL